MNTIRRRLRTALRNARRDTRGVALQTVIVIVVLLVIAGSVSAVLLSRGSDVVGELENVSIGGLTEDTCLITTIGGVAGDFEDVATTTGGIDAGKYCVWKGGGNPYDPTADTDISAAQCFAGGGGAIVTPTAAVAGITNGKKACVAKIA
ncbi:MAG: hypothetical protein F4117_15150 [Acidimicrobiales bacterium]|nr:hypothetical protein [Acidimicrobiales bacterium]MYB80652.1 hypothetical protein [Acidimicrobiales bacterium]MYI13886.1 hypothetical protein [Acidimicrobiales bacterium]